MTHYMDHINFVLDSELDIALNAYQQRGDTRSRRVFTLQHPQGHRIVSKNSFYDAVAATFPLNPLLSEERLAEYKYNMGALIDSLHGGIRGVEEQLIDIVWPEFDVVAAESIPTLVHGVDLLNYALFGFRDVNFSRNTYTRLLLIYTGNQPGFSSGFW